MRQPGRSTSKSPTSLSLPTHRAALRRYQEAELTDWSSPPKKKPTSSSAKMVVKLASVQCNEFEFSKKKKRAIFLLHKINSAAALCWLRTCSHAAFKQTRTHSRLHSTGATGCLPNRGIRVDPALPVEVCRPNYTVLFAVS